MARTRENEIGADEVNVELAAANGSVESVLRHLSRAWRRIVVAERRTANDPRRHIDPALRIQQGAVA